MATITPPLIRSARADEVESLTDDTDQQDLVILNQSSEGWNDEIQDILTYQVDLFDGE